VPEVENFNAQTQGHFNYTTYHNFNDYNFYPNPQESDPYSFRSRMAGFEEFDPQGQSSQILTDRWEVVAQPGPIAGSSTGARATMVNGKYHHNIFDD
jgi:hypothetical protein